MAKKAYFTRQLQEMSGQADIMERQPSDLVAAVYLMQLRASTRKVTTPRRRLAVNADHAPQIPEPVRIVRIA